MSQFLEIMFYNIVPPILHFVLCFFRAFFHLFWQILPRCLAYSDARLYCVCISYFDSVCHCSVVDVCAVVVYLFVEECVVRLFVF